MQLSAHFTLSEFLRSTRAEQLHINNSHYDAVQLANMKALCVYVLEPLRARLRQKFHPEAVIVITSGFRCPALNAAVGGTKISQHLRGQAADIHVEVEGIRAMTAQELFVFIQAQGFTTIVDQCIQEFDAWVHVSYNPKRAHQRGQFFYAWSDRKGKTVFTNTRPVAGLNTQNAPLT